MNTPNVILESFVPTGVALTCDMGHVIVLERVGSPFITGGEPKFYDIVAAHYVLSRLTDAMDALRAGLEKFEAAVMDYSRSAMPSDLKALTTDVRQAVERAFAPVAGDEGDEAKKPEVEAVMAGG